MLPPGWLRRTRCGTPGWATTPCRTWPPAWVVTCRSACLAGWLWEPVAGSSCTRWTAGRRGTWRWCPVMAGWRLPRCSSSSTTSDPTRASPTDTGPTTRWRPSSPPSSVASRPGWRRPSKTTCRRRRSRCSPRCARGCSPCRQPARAPLGSPDPARPVSDCARSARIRPTSCITSPSPGTAGRSRRPDPHPARTSSAPDLGRRLDDEGELGHLVVVGQRVALHGGGEAALRGQAQLLERHILAGLLDPALQGVLGLQLAAFRRHQAEHHHLARRDEPQRLEGGARPDRKSTRLNSSHVAISYAVFCLKKKNTNTITT